MKRKQIRVTLILSDKEETFTADGQNALSATGFRVLADVSYGNGAILPIAFVKIYGLSAEKMNKLLRVQWNTMGALMNKVRLEAGNHGEELHNVFEGNITFAYPDYSESPNIALVIEAQSASEHLIRAADPVTHEGQVDVVTLIELIVKRIGLDFKNDGFSKQVSNITLNDTDIAKILRLSRAYEFDYYLDGNLITITEQGKPRKLKVPVITPKTGLIGYPVPSIKGIDFKCLYDPLVRFGAVVRIKDSIIEPANGDWKIYGLRLVLEANQPNGAWFCEVNATWSNAEDAAI
ncbi:hypothetical protein AAEX37_01948 [Oligella sp. MSHR50489EDL]|uniref:baseplate hub protein n=1 Tax=Oligella sp. MSHR50489EDL TaxID=3139409 RepID=UPI003D8182D8